MAEASRLTGQDGAMPGPCWRRLGSINSKLGMGHLSAAGTHHCHSCLQHPPRHAVILGRDIQPTAKTDSPAAVFQQRELSYASPESGFVFRVSSGGIFKLSSAVQGKGRSKEQARSESQGKRKSREREEKAGKY